MDRLTAMETFVSVVEAGSFSGGARRLRVGQPAVSKSIALLESTLGVRLFVRTTRGLTPTEAGQRFYERATAVIAAADDAQRQAREAGASLSGLLRVSAPVTLARLHLVPGVHTFLARHPELRLDLVLDDRRTDLLTDGIDVALRLGVLEDAGSMTARKIAESPRRVIATPNYFTTAGVPRTPADLPAHETIVYDQQSGGTSWTFVRGDSELSVTVSGRMRISAAEGVREAVLAGAGLTIASEWMFAPELESGRRSLGADRLDAAADVLVERVSFGSSGQRQGASIRHVRRTEAAHYLGDSAIPHGNDSYRRRLTTAAHQTYRRWTRRDDTAIAHRQGGRHGIQAAGLLRRVSQSENESR